VRSRAIGAGVMIAACFLAGLALASCGGDGSGNTTETTSTTTETTTTTAETTTGVTTETTTTTGEPPPGPTVVRVRVVGGVPKGGIVRETVKQDERVVIVVTSDVADHVHLHGYDIMRDVAPGQTARIRFRASVPGRFAVELEDRGVQIASLTVEP
jgi:hypothetical protein